MPNRPLRLLIANHRWWFPTTVSGGDVANHEFARRLARNNMEVRVFGMVAPNVDGTTRQRGYVTDGVRVNLVQSDFIKKLTGIIEEFRPNIVMTSCPETSCSDDDIHRMMNVFKQYSLPVIMYIHELEPVMSLFDGVQKKLAAVCTNSQFMAGKIQARWDREVDVIYPVPSSRTFQVADTSGDFITFFNPLPHKGLDIVEQLVKEELKDRAFLFVEGFMEAGSHGIALVRAGNVVHARRSPDVATIYTMTRTLIIPSQWEEPFGRVALEAMYNQIPVIASNTGGLPESVGEGGILIDDFSNVHAWAEAIRKMDDEAFRDEMIEAGFEHMERFSLEQQYDGFITVFNRVMN
ncbi:MAG: glycosyltransferase family 4 protein [Deltaproteobacteria bacterium]|nr:glycosyltransferase family 4 protein [Deltaproteobacteria bacterium]MBN2674301.1 glycosyltransferase family 4 protein [Deltaproteobacteria bacterium]